MLIINLNNISLLLADMLHLGFIYIKSKLEQRMFLRSLQQNPTFKLLCLFFLFFCSNSLCGQDTTKNLTLQPINIVALRPIPERLPSVEDVFVYEGKKNEVIRLKGITANLITNNARQIFSRIPGISIWENEVWQ